MSDLQAQLEVQAKLIADLQSDLERYAEARKHSEDCVRRIRKENEGLRVEGRRLLLLSSEVKDLVRAIDGCVWSDHETGKSVTMPRSQWVEVLRASEPQRGRNLRATGNGYG